MVSVSYRTVAVLELIFLFASEYHFVISILYYFLILDMSSFFIILCFNKNDNYFMMKKVIFFLKSQFFFTVKLIFLTTKVYEKKNIENLMILFLNIIKFLFGFESSSVWSLKLLPSRRTKRIHFSVCWQGHHHHSLDVWLMEKGVIITKSHLFNLLFSIFIFS